MGTDYLRIAQEIEEGLVRALASIYEPDPTTGSVSCEPVELRSGLMNIARTARWVRGLHEAHVDGATVAAFRASRKATTPSHTKAEA